jgi:hypothetical protein
MSSPLAQRDSLDMESELSPQAMKSLYGQAKLFCALE